MKLVLKDFQENAVEKLYGYARLAKREVEEGGDAQALVLASPTGSGKTMIATALMECIVQGDEDHQGDERAVFLWLTDAPDLNEQSRRKIRDSASVFGVSDLITIDSSFDHSVFEPGNIYFLNTQKLGKEKNLVTPGDERSYTIWETVENTRKATPGSFWLILDEAHKGMLEDKDRQAAATIVQKFVKGSAGEIDAVPLILGISATPERFVEVLEGEGTSRIKRPLNINPEDVRASGLLKERIVLFHPTEAQPSDWSLLRASAEKLQRFRDQWNDYCDKENEVQFEPILVVQVEDSDGKSATRTDLEEALGILEDVLGPLDDYEIAHSFQEGVALDVGERVLRYVSPADIQDDETLRVIFFKLSLNTGWDCPRAEVIMSFRRALDYTRIAQLVGRLVRTPLARYIQADDFLNSVALYLPHYDRKSLKTVIDYLSKPETGLVAPPEIVEGDELVELPRDESKKELFNVAATLPTYAVERISKATNVRRLVRLGRALAYDKLAPDELDATRAFVISSLDKERRRKEKDPDFTKAITEHSHIELRGVTVSYGTDTENEELDDSFETIRAVSRNIEDLYDQGGRKLGEGLQAAWVKTRVAGGTVKPVTAKLELHELLSDPKAITKVESAAQKRFQELSENHKAAIVALPDGRREVYRRLRRQAAKPEPEELTLPDIYDEPGGADVFKSHLYADENGDFACKLDSSWEREVVNAELLRPDVLGWLRNVPRKSWALKIPYKRDGEDAPMFPDFLFFRRQGGGIVVDILEPHNLSQADSAAKAVGLADFAAAHGDKFGRIEFIVKEKDELIRLNVNDDGVRDKVRAVSDNQHLRQLLENAATSE